MNEQISALIDDEIDLDEAMHIVTAMLANGSAAQAWSHYHLIGDAMRGTSALSPSFKQALMHKIELEPTVLSPNKALTNSNYSETLPATANIANVKKLPAAWSIAASFAAVMVVGYMVMQMQVSLNDGEMRTAQNQASLTQAALTQATPVQVAQAFVSRPAAMESAPALVMASENAIPAEYLNAHQASAPTGSAYFIQAASFSE